MHCVMGKGLVVVLSAVLLILSGFVGDCTRSSRTENAKITPTHNPPANANNGSNATVDTVDNAKPGPLSLGGD